MSEMFPDTITKDEQKRVLAILKEWRSKQGERYPRYHSTLEAGERLPEASEADDQTTAEG